MLLPSSYVPSYAALSSRPVRPRRLILTLALLCLSALGHAASAGTLAVPGQYATIQAALNASVSGDTVLISDGTYAGPGNVDLDFGGKNLTVQAVSLDPAKTVIDCGGSSAANHRGFTFHTGETGAVLRGLTIKNGYGGSGGAVSVESGCTVTLTDCTLTANTAQIGGGLSSLGATVLTDCSIDGNTAAYCGGIYNGAGTMSLTQCSVSGNTGINGGGMQNAGTATLSFCLLAGNYSSGYGGGLCNNGATLTVSSCDIDGNTAFSGGALFTSGLATVTNCLLTANTAYSDFYAGPGDINGGGGGIYCHFGLVSVTNCTLTGNTATNGGGLYNGLNTTATLTNDILYGDASGPGGELYAETSADASATPTVLYCDIQGGHAGTNNVNADPLFVSSSPPYDPNLQVGSPCVGAGTSSGAPARDIGGNPRDNPPSIGAWEGQRRARTATSLISSLNPSPVGQSVTFTATVTGSTAGSSAAPSGSVQFASDGTNVGGPVALSGGTAGVSTAALPGGSHAVTAVYSGDPLFKSSTGTLTQTVAVVATRFSVAAPATVAAGAAFTVTVTAQDGSGSTVTGYTGTAFLSSSDYTAALPAPGTFVNGVCVFTVRLHGVGSQTLNAYQYGDSSVTGQSGVITVIQETPTTRSVPDQYATIQAAIDASVDGDTVLVGDGTYSGAGNRDLDFHSLTLTVQSQNGPSVTLIDCGGSASSDGSGDHRGFTLHSSESNPVISGFTIENGYESRFTADGGAVDMGSSIISFTNLTLANCILTANYAAGGGGGVSVGNGAGVTLTGCTLTGNSAGVGGGLFGDGFTVLTDCVFDSNSASFGGAICNGDPIGYSSGGSQNYSGYLSLTGCTFTDNNAGDGGALYNPGGTLTLTSCLLSGNSAQDSGGALSNADSAPSSYNSVTTSGQATLTGCTLAGNTASQSGGAINNGDPPFSSNSFNGSLTLTDCLLTDNSATGGNGGAINNGRPPYSSFGNGFSGGFVSLTDCLLAGNSAAGGGGSLSGNGGAFYTNSGFSTVTSCSLTANAANSGGGIYSDIQASVSLTNDILFADTSNEITDNNNPQAGFPQNNVSATFCDIGEAAGIGNFSDNGGNVSADPQFVSGDAPFDLFLARGSPCLGAGTHNGTPTTTLDGAVRPDPPSIGAYELSAQAGDTTALTSSLNPSAVGQSVTFTAAVTGSSPTGAVTFTDGGGTLGTSALSGGVATLTTAALTAGSHVITAAYGGDANNASGTSPTLIQTVTGNVVSTTTTVTSSLNPSTAGQSVTFTATVTGSSPIGTVTFSDGSTALGTGTVDSSGNAVLSTSALSVGLHTVTAAYGGDTSNAASVSDALTQTVNLAGTTTTLASSLNPSTFGQAVTFTAVVTGSSPTGNVTFSDGGAALGTGTVDGSGSAALTLSTLAVGLHTVTAAYVGDGSNAASDSAPLTQTVRQVTTITTLASNFNPSMFSRSVTFTATVSGSSPTGIVTFSDGSTTLGTGTVDGSGNAVLSTSALSVGPHTVTAAYGGDADNTVSVSVPLTQTVIRVTTTTALTSSLNPSAVGQSVTFTAAVTGSSPTGAVTFTNGGATLGTGAVSGGVATLTTAALTAGSHTLAAVYGGDANNAPSTSPPLTQVVLTATAVTLPNVTGAAGQTVTLPATLKTAAGAALSGRTLTFSVDGTSIGTAVTSAAGVAAKTYAVPTALTTGGHVLTVTFAGDATSAASTGTGTLTVTPTGTTLALTAVSGTPGAATTLKATLKRTAGGAAVAGAVVTFSVDGSVVGTAVTNGAGLAGLPYVIPVGAAPGSSHPTGAAFSGSGSLTASSGASTLTVSKLATSLSVSSAGGTPGQTVTFSATLKSGSAPLSGRTVSFTVDGAAVGTAVTSAAGFATLSYAIPAGAAASAHALAATFAGDATSLAAVGKGTLTVKSATALSVANLSGARGASVSLTATLTAGGAASPGKTITFKVDGKSVGTAVTDGLGTASLPYAIPATTKVGTHSVSASFAGDAGSNAAGGTGTLTVH